jgi:hypothetical protein
MHFGYRCLLDHFQYMVHCFCLVGRWAGLRRWSEDFVLHFGHCG